MTQSYDDALLWVFTARASGYIKDASVIGKESESDITEQLKRLLKNLKNDPIPSLRSADAFWLGRETEEVDKAMSSITLNDISDFKNLIKADELLFVKEWG